MELKQLGRYEVLEELGRGSMGVVYLARDPMIERKVAVKTVPLGLGVDPSRRESYLRRLRREALAAGKLSHPNIVVIYDVGEEGDTFYMAMEYLKGASLDKLLRKGRKFSTDEASRIMSDVADALDHAHSRDVIHRDIKPSNLFLTDDNIVKVTDFGIAKMPLASLTGEGRIVGSPSYMSPEQVRGKTVDARSDVFSMGVVMYILLTGKKPFGGGEVPQIIYRIVNEEPPPPSAVDPSLTEAVDGPIAKALSKESRARYQSAGALMKAFRESIEKDVGQHPTVAPGEESSGTGDMRRPFSTMDRYREESSGDGVSKINQMFHEITSEVRNVKVSGYGKKKRKKRK